MAKKIVRSRGLFQAAIGVARMGNIDKVVAKQSISSFEFKSLAINLLYQGMVCLIFLMSVPWGTY